VKITGVEVVNLRYDYPSEEVLSCAEGPLAARVTSLVIVRTDSELVGLGSVYSHPDLVKLIIEYHLAPFLIGRDPKEIEKLWDMMYSLTRWYGRKGVAVSAIGGVDIALWDLAGKVREQALFRLLGGSSPIVGTYASGLLWRDDMSLLADEARSHVDAGFDLVKMRLGRDPEYDRASVEAVLVAIDGRARLAVDGTHRYSLEAAVPFGRYLGAREVAWFEEPFPPEDIDAYTELRSAGTGVPIAAGENEFGLQGFRELFRAGAIDIAQPDVSRTGGITEGLRISALAQAAGIPIVTHTWSDAVAIVANAHFVASSPTGARVEVDRTGTPLMDGLLTAPLIFTEGNLVLTEEPGLGIELDDDVLHKFTVADDVLLRDGNYADLVFGGQPYDSVPPHARASYK